MFLKNSVHFLFLGRNLDQEQEEAIAHQTAHQNEQNAQEQLWVAKYFYLLQNFVIDGLTSTMSVLLLRGHTAWKSIFELISGSAAWFFLIILKFVFTSIFEI